MNDWEVRYLQSMTFTVVVGTSATITLNPFTPRDYKFYDLFIGQEIPANTGTEPVFLNVSGTNYPLVDRAGNVVTVGKLRGAFFNPYIGGIKATKYRIQYGSNGLPTAIPHFVVHEGLRPLIYNGAAGSED